MSNAFLLAPPGALVAAPALHGTVRRDAGTPLTVEAAASRQAAGDRPRSGAFAWLRPRPRVARSWTLDAADLLSRS